MPSNSYSRLTEPKFNKNSLFKKYVQLIDKHTQTSSCNASKGDKKIACSLFTTFFDHCTQNLSNAADTKILRHFSIRGI